MKCDQLEPTIIVNYHRDLLFNGWSVKCVFSFTFREAERKKSKRNFPGNCLEDNTMNNMKSLYVDTVPCKQSKPEMKEPRAPVKCFYSCVYQYFMILRKLY